MRRCLAIALAALTVTSCACTACRRGSGEGENAPPAAASAAAASSSVAAKAAGSGGGIGAAPVAESASLLWTHAKDGEEEDLAALAAHEGAAGLAAAAKDPEKRTTALRAASSARGYAHVAWLADTATGGSDDDARLALEALADIGARVRRAEEHEDEEELASGCTKLGELARDKDKPRERRVGAVRAVRTLPCPKIELPTDVDAR